MRKLGQTNITGVIHCISGLRVGGSDDLLQIGGTDLTCIKNPVTLQPYIPGSSMKGKMRSELEKKLGKFGGRDGNEPCSCARRDCLICRVFGPHKKPDHDLGPTRIIVRDGLLIEGGELELKPENIIDRRTGTALHPRKVERVVAGSRFRLKIGIQIWDLDNECSYNDSTGGAALVAFVKDGLREIANTGLGSGVSKGSGEIEIEDLKED
jgi:CRISPR-associated protein Csm3